MIRFTLKFTLYFAWFLLGWVPMVLGSTYGPPERSIEDHLRRFEANPVQVMNEELLRWGGGDYPRFSQRAIEKGEAVAVKDRERAKMCMKWRGHALCLGQSQGVLAATEGSDLPEALVDNGANGMIRSLERLDQAGLRRATLPNQPWSDDYWGLYKGSLGARYADPYFPGTLDWLSNRSYVESVPASAIAKAGTPSQVDVLSPSEKYELLIGDSDFSITGLMWERGQRYYDDAGSVESWLGLCQGWAAAAMSLSRPANSVVLRSANGKHDLRFYPSDIKALATLLWSEGTFETRFVGGRCNDRVPVTDANGRIVSKKCFDTNPGTWHLAVTNQIGASRRSLVMDASYDYRVWNQPVLGYSYTYFNPQKQVAVPKLRDAYVSMSEYSRDKFRNYRSAHAVGVVGIVMELTYGASTRPSHAKTDSPQNDRHVTVQYVYDLELDRVGNIIGGEWYTNKHPDFLWVPAPEARAVSRYEEEATEPWRRGHPIPVTWRNAARNAARSGQPLAKIVEEMSILSKVR